jgi:hypothetical protein
MAEIASSPGKARLSPPHACNYYYLNPRKKKLVRTKIYVGEVNHKRCALSSSIFLKVFAVLEPRFRLGSGCSVAAFDRLPYEVHV